MAERERERERERYIYIERERENKKKRETETETSPSLPCCFHPWVFFFVENSLAFLQALSAVILRVFVGSLCLERSQWFDGFLGKCKENKEKNDRDSLSVLPNANTKSHSMSLLFMDSFQGISRGKALRARILKKKLDIFSLA